MRRIKLFENFNSDTIEDVLDSIQYLLDDGIIVARNKPFFTFSDETIDDENSYYEIDESKPSIAMSYKIQGGLDKINSVDKIRKLKTLIDYFEQAMVRLDQFSTYLLDFERQELTIQLSVPDNIKELTTHFGFNSIDSFTTDNAMVYSYENDIDGFPYDLIINIKVDDKLNITVECKTKKANKLEGSSEALINHFTQTYGLEFIKTEEKGAFIFWSFKNV